MVVNYFDESGMHGGANITSIAGYVATQETWVALEADWKVEMAILADKGVKNFHMNNAIIGTDEYLNLDHFHRFAHIKRVSEILANSDIQAIGVWVDNNEWAQVAPKTKFFKSFPNPYSFCFEHIVHYLRMWAMQNANGESVVPVFAWHQEHSPKMTALYGAQTWYRDVLAAISFGFPTHIIPLQAADFIAHQLNYDTLHVNYHDWTIANGGRTLAFDNATKRNGKHMLHGYSFESLLTADQRFVRTGKIC